MSGPPAYAGGTDLIFLLALIEGVTTFAVKVAKVLRLDEIKTGAVDTAEQIDYLLMSNVCALRLRHEAAAPLIRTKCFGFATRPNLYASVADHRQIQPFRRNFA